MIKILLALGVACVTQLSMAGDKELIRDACTALKAPAKRTLCLDALERVIAPGLTPISEPVPEKPASLSLRGMNCETYEFSEINSLSAKEMEALYCSYSAGVNSSESATNKMTEKYSGDLRSQAGFLQMHIKTMEKCNSAQAKVRELAARKFPPGAMDCGKFAPKSAAKE